MLYPVTVLYHTVQCHTVSYNCTACCKACALCAALQLGLCVCLSPIPLPPLVTPRCLASTPEPNSLALGGGGGGEASRVAALPRPARSPGLPAAFSSARRAPRPCAHWRLLSAHLAALVSRSGWQRPGGEGATPPQPAREETPRINALLKSAKERGKRRSCACSFQNWSQNFYWVKSRHFIHQLADSRTRGNQLVGGRALGRCLVAFYKDEAKTSRCLFCWFSAWRAGGATLFVISATNLRINIKAVAFGQRPQPPPPHGR